MSVRCSLNSLYLPDLALVTTPTTYSKLSLDHISEQCLAQDATGGWFSWQLPDGSGVSINTTHNQLCETQLPTGVLKYLLYTPGGSAYSMAGIAVDKSAIGAPFNLLSYGFDGSFGAGADHMSMDPMFQWATQCFPVLGTNPVKCQEGGNVTINTNSITVSANDCEISTPIYSVDPSTQGASAAGACTSGKAVGTATLVFGSVNSQARLLASIFRESSFNGSAFAAFCTVDIGPSFTFRTLNYSRVSAQLDSDSEEGFQFFVSGSDFTCTQRNGTHEISLDQLQTPTALATGAAASWQLLAEGAYADGWWATLWDAVANQDRINFKGSQNSLEDVLGVASGIALGAFWGTILTYDDILVTPITGSNVTYTGLRLGPGSAWSIVYCLPLLFACGLLVSLIWKTRGRELETDSYLKLVKA